MTAHAFVPEVPSVLPSQRRSRTGAALRDDFVVSELPLPPEAAGAYFLSYGQKVRRPYVCLAN